MNDKPQNKTGRPAIVLSDRQKRELLKHAGRTNQMMCAHLIGVSPKTLRKLLKEDPELNAGYLKARAEMMSQIGGGLYVQALKGSVKAAELLFKMHGVIETPGNVNIYNNGDSSLDVTDHKDLSKEEYRQQMKEMHGHETDEIPDFDTDFEFEEAVVIDQSAPDDDSEADFQAD